MVHEVDHRPTYYKSFETKFKN